MLKLDCVRSSRARNWLRDGVLLVCVAIMTACSMTQPVERVASVTPPEGAVLEVEYSPPEPQVNYPDVPRYGKAILVNIPSFQLIAFEDGKPVLRSRVIVGKPSTPTPVMRTATSVVRFRPTWTPTPRMIRSGKYRPGTRPAGPSNPLGFLAIRLAPEMLIYLHGTNKPELFDKEQRALSHGCVRVEKWAEVAAWVLGTSIEDVQAYAFGQRTFDAPTGGIPVIVTYQLQFPDAAGVTQDLHDVYRRGGESILATSL